MGCRSPDREAWRRFGDELKGRECILSFDSTKSFDLAAMCLRFPPIAAGERTKFLWQFWLPSETIEQRTKAERTPFDEWAKHGALTSIPGGVFELDYAVKAALKACTDYRVSKIGWDAWNAMEFYNRMVAAGQPERSVRRNAVRHQVARPGHARIRAQGFRRRARSRRPSGRALDDRTLQRPLRRKHELCPGEKTIRGLDRRRRRRRDGRGAGDGAGSAATWIDPAMSHQNRPTGPLVPAPALATKAAAAAPAVQNLGTPTSAFTYGSQAWNDLFGPNARGLPAPTELHRGGVDGDLCLHQSDFRRDRDAAGQSLQGRRRQRRARPDP
jgi:hypothetical protein